MSRRVQIMNMTIDQVDYLIGLKKKIIGDSIPADVITIDQVFPLHLRYELVAQSDDEFSFLWEITQSGKDELRVSLHYQEDASKIGLFRVDYNSGHKNPTGINDNLPEKFIPYVGKVFDNTESHVHYFVEGYKPLVWALPIGDTELKATNYTNKDNLSDKLVNCIIEFAKFINIETKININKMLL